MKILAIETSCDDTCVAILDNQKILSNVISSQIDLFKKWGGVVPDIAKRAHQDRIWPVVNEALKRSGLMKDKDGIDEAMKKVDLVAVTQGPGLAIALGVGIDVAKELVTKYKKKLVAVNHIEGHILSNFLKNRNGKPNRKIKFPTLVLTVSGGHTKLVLMKGIGKYEVIGQSLDDAAGEALDKASKMLGFSYPGGPIIERLAKEGNKNFLKLPRPMSQFKNYDYSFSGLKTSFYYQIREWKKERISKRAKDLAASFQNAVFDSLLIKLSRAIDGLKPKSLLASGGVMANLELRKRLRKLAKEKGLPVYMPFKKELNTDNGAMIGIAGYYKYKRSELIKKVDRLERQSRLEL
ncbi:tRNA (adenosine(37)-N6)-threonylcarbamoyltransferase complex transferase subunit TsaD [Candidatus Shapirobacteria bacterium]|nr:MAG: tRNA (adenosine(37)-N6)-threonylcarbamoyltransferase complex transferase subunit TsaD [Candidatus Shapirobacteria bacterium]